MGVERELRRVVAVALVGLLAACGAGAGVAEPPQSSTGPARTSDPAVSASRTAPQSPSLIGTATQSPSARPSLSLTSGPTAQPTASRTPTRTPTGTPTATPTLSPSPSVSGLPTSLLGHVVSRLPTAKRVVALTFDAGGNAAGVGSILATLRAKGVPGSFFLTGHFVDVRPTASRRMAAAGRVGNHTVSHPQLPKLSNTRVRAEVRGARTAILEGTGEDPRPWFRFPYGSSSPRTVALVNSMGYVAVGWTVDTLGWMGTSRGITAKKVVSRVLAARTPGMIVLMHVGSNPDDHSTLDADALPRVIDRLRAAGYSFVTLDALLT